MNKIDAQAKSVSDLLSNKKYTIDYYQREYKWEKEQITELMQDLEAKFLENYEEKQVLKEKVDSIEEKFDGMPRFHLNLWSKRYIHHILARITAHIEEQSNMASNFSIYVSREIKKPYEIEHIWADHYEQHTDEFGTEEDFSQYRNRIGNLILLPGDINRSINDNRYEEKLPVYSGQNVLAKSLDEQFYHNNPSFLAYKNSSGLPFRSHLAFKKADLDARQQLYRLICEEIWSPSRFDRELV